MAESFEPSKDVESAISLPIVVQHNRILITDPDLTHDRGEDQGAWFQVWPSGECLLPVQFERTRQKSCLMGTLTRTDVYYPQRGVPASLVKQPLRRDFECNRDRRTRWTGSVTGRYHRVISSRAISRIRSEMYRELELVARMTCAPDRRAWRCTLCTAEWETLGTMTRTVLAWTTEDANLLEFVLATSTVTPLTAQQRYCCSRRASPPTTRIR